jgi:hypothetical protein
MRKMIVIAIILLLLLTNCNIISNLADLPDKSTESWQTVFVNGVGSFRVPTEWVVEQEDGIVYITDKPRDNEEYKVYIIGVVEADEIVSKYSQPHELFDDVEKVDSIPYGGYSNSTRLNLVKYTVNGNKEEHLLIHCPKIKTFTIASLELLVWDMDIVDEKLAREIAKTFTMEK